MRTVRAAVDSTRPLCPHPEVAAYKGTGSTDDAANFACKASGPFWARSNCRERANERGRATAHRRSGWRETWKRPDEDGVRRRYLEGFGRKMALPETWKPAGTGLGSLSRPSSKPTALIADDPPAAVW